MKTVRIILVILLAVGLLMLLPSLSSMSVQDVLDYTPEYPLLVALLFLLLFCAKAFVQVIPLGVLYTAAGIALPPLWAVVVVLVCLGCEMSLGYLLGSKLGMEYVQKQVEQHQRAELFLEMVNRHGPAACFLARLVPIPIPLDVVSMFFGSSGVPYPQYLVFSLLGISAKAVPLVLAAGAVEEPTSARFWGPFVFCLLVSAGAFLFYFFRERKKGGNKEG